MKTIVVLSALVAVAIAAPAQIENGFEDLKTFTKLPEPIKREIKSVPQELSTTSHPAPGVPAHLPSTSQVSEFGVSGRTFGLKKPIIVKKKQGYHVYRDSDEEQLAMDSDETCGKQVKVKLCDDKNNMMRSSTIEDADTKMTDEDVKHSIKLAKEAMESLQRDWKKIDHKAGTTDSDAELHKDIEVAREALEHIHKNLHATVPKDEEVMQHDQLPIAQSEEERLAQWKEAMETIHRNVEIAKNIEDSFKVASEDTGLSFLDGEMANGHKNELDEVTTNMKTAQNTEETKKEDCKVEPEHEKSSVKDNLKSEIIEDDMKTSASTTSETKTEDLENVKTSHTSLLPKNAIDQVLKTEDTLDTHGKDAELQTLTLGDISQKQNLMSDSMKTEEIKEKKPLELPRSEDILTEHNRNAALQSHDPQLHESSEHHENIKKLEKNEDKNTEMKSAEHVEKINNINMEEDNKQEMLHTEQPKEVDTTMFVKSSEQIPLATPKESLADSNKHDSLSHMEHLEKLSTQPKMVHSENPKEQTENLMVAANTPEQMQFQQMQSSELRPEMKAVHEMKNVHPQMVDPTQTRWAEEKRLDHMGLMKSADSMHSQTMDHSSHMQMSGHQHSHMGHAMKSPHHFDTPNLHAHPHHSRIPESMVPGPSRAADMDMQANYFMNMRDSGSLTPEGHRLRWRPTHGSARSSYGAPAAPASASPSSGASGAVGLFPNANVGSCGIPLLLSCNPSVVSGSLAKAHPAPYSTPAYRTEDDFNFHTKRDVKKTNEKQLKTLKRTPSDILKTSTVLAA